METAPASENVAAISRYALRGGGFDDRDAYLAAPSDEKDAAKARRFREALWAALHATRLNVVRPGGASFAHLGTTRELLAMLTRPSPFRAPLGLSPRSRCLAPPPGDGDAWGVVLNGVVDKAPPAGAVVEHSVLGEATVGAGGLASCVRELPPGFSVPPRCLLQQVQLVDGRFVCVLLGVDDDVKAGEGDGAYLGRPWAETFARLGAAGAEIWPGGAGTLWTAALFPPADTAAGATALAAGLLEGGDAAAWRAAPERLSLKDVLAAGDKVAEVRWKASVAKTIRVRARLRSKVTVTAPLRVDLAGGWSDTPPICHEHGGSVANVAVTIDGARPAGLPGGSQRITVPSCPD